MTVTEIPPKRKRSFGTPLLLLGIIVSTAGVGLGAAWFTTRFLKSLEPEPLAGTTPTNRSEAATVMFDTPADILPETIKVGVFQGGGAAKAADGSLLDKTNAAKLARVGLPPGEYVFRIKYREKAIPELKVALKRGERRLLSPAYTRMADAEYTAGLRAAEREGDQDVPYFRRVLALNPDHIEAHFQLAAYALAEGDALEADEHITALRRLAPKDPRLEEVEKRYKRLR